ncbi:aspartate--tRNA ligase [Mariprofundus erugo]|uniref:Aspartate--tRNA(Asp/Asn) ligase n=1 Tax=Mariprofundus erugo TaxID=2528639 RepID=A0A5R9GSD9_9PROT|nr:aspartate--tRNA ligase [Mariprofundus erugo]TLS67975.1 aspartate--tRNA ligase [Mariprofundus erugo]TLS74888.1 aspartate--tRNA ligase [Mariprofundus erugo]
MLPRTHCGDFRVHHIGQTVRLNGWAQTNRDHGGVVFIDVRDRTGLVQIVVHPDDPAVHQLAHSLRQQDVIEVVGQVIARSEETVNSKLATGSIEIKASAIVVLNRSETPPFMIDDSCDTGEQARLEYRYLDLRRPKMQGFMALRHRVTHAARNFLDSQNFLEIETPILNKSTPEGARDYLVPSRVYPGSFFALPQSPQIFKQLLMVAGMDRYYQIARCFRDEDLRADRQPEFTQVDIELSFVSQDDVMAVAEGLLRSMFDAGVGIHLPETFPRITYAEAMDKYGVDRPDIRFGLEHVDITALMKRVEFKVFREPADNGGLVKVMRVPAGGALSRKQIDDYTKFVSIYGAKGLAWIKVNDLSDLAGGLQSPIVKFLPEDVLAELLQISGAENGDLLFFGAGETKIVNDALGNLRVKVGHDMGLVAEGDHRFVWVVDFPMFAWNPDEKRPEALHHPFTSPYAEDLDKLETDPLNMRSQAYDLVWNGTEIGGGSIRIHNPEVQQRVFRTLGITDEEAENKFGFLIKALKYGAPPHGGLAFGLDRVLSLMAGVDSIRDVIAFPKTQKAADPMSNAPSEVSDAQWQELGLRKRRVLQES